MDIADMSPEYPRRPRGVRARGRYAAALLAAALLAGVAPASRVHATIGGCAGDPIVTLSNGTSVDLSATVADDLSDVAQIVYTLHAPAGSSVTSVTSIGPKEVLRFVADNPPGVYDSATRVSTYTAAGVAVTATTTVVPVGAVPATGSASGRDNETLLVRLAP